MELFNRLKDAQKEGKKFEKSLPGHYTLTHGFKKLSGMTRYVCLSLVLAGGLTGCNSMQHMANFENLKQEAEVIESLSTQAIDDHINKRGSEQPDQSIEIVDFDEFVKQYEEKRAFPYNHPVRIENPFVAGQYFEVIDGSSLSSHLRLIATHGPNALHISDSINGQTYIVDPTGRIPSLESGISSLYDQDKNSTIVLGDILKNNSTFKFNSISEQISYILHHEFIHGHTMQDVSEFTNANSIFEMTFSHEAASFNEAHSDVAAMAMRYKSLDLEPQEFVEEIVDLTSDFNRFYLEKSNGDGTSKHIHRADKGFQVLAEIVRKDADFIKNIPDSQIPMFAYDVVKSAGLYHNASDLIIDKHMLGDSKVNEQLNRFHVNKNGRLDASLDEWLINDIERAYDDYEIRELTSSLRDVHKKEKLGSQIDSYIETLTDIVNETEDPIETRYLVAYQNKMKAEGLTNEDFYSTLKSHIEISHGSYEFEDLRGRLLSLRQDLQNIRETIPSYESLVVESEQIKENIEVKLKELGEALEQQDPKSALYKGVLYDKSYSEMANIIINTSDYGYPQGTEKKDDRTNNFVSSLNLESTDRKHEKGTYYEP